MSHHQLYIDAHKLLTTDPVEYSAILYLNHTPKITSKKTLKSLKNHLRFKTNILHNMNFTIYKEQNRIYCFAFKIENITVRKKLQRIDNLRQGSIK